MAEPGPRAVYASKAWEIDLHRRELRSRGVSIPIGSRAFELLEVLVQSGGELVNKYQLIDRVWPGAVVEENTLHFHISAIRKAFGADRAMINTVSGRGYRLLGNWAVQQPGEPEPRVDAAERRPRQPWRTNLPIAASALIGRSAPRQHLLKVLSAYRVVTLTGPPGIGKSVLALEVARSLFPTFEGDCWLVELASLSDPALVPSAVVPVLGLKIGGTVISPKSVARAIGGEKLLLMLDNASTSLTRWRDSRKPSSACARMRPCWRPAARSCGPRANMSIAFRRWMCRRSGRTRSMSTNTLPSSSSPPD